MSGQIYPGVEAKQDELVTVWSAEQTIPNFEDITAPCGGDGPHNCEGSSTEIRRKTK
jgi:hypothetical protein